MADIIQKATEWSKQSKKFLSRYRDLEDCVGSSGYVWQPKYDGIHCIIDTTQRTAFTRENTPLPSIQHVVDYLSNACGAGHVFQGEVWIPDTPFKDISGAARRLTVQPHLGVVLYDWHTWGYFDCGYDPRPYSFRWQALQDQLIKISGYPLVGTAGSYPVRREHPGHWQTVAQDYVTSGGYDGLILRSTVVPWQAGPCRNGELIKVKPSVSLDLRCNGVIQGEGKHAGKLGALTVSYLGVNSSVGTGFSDDERDRYWRAALAGDKTSNPIGQIVEVECMCVNDNNTLREPRFKAVRWDKTEPDA